MRRRLVALAGALLLAGCGLNLAETPPPSGPPATPVGSLAVELEAVRGALAAALRSGAAVSLEDAPEGYRPAEPPVLAFVPRAVFKVRLPNDPNRLYVVLYDFPDARAAADAGTQADAFYASGPALVQFPADTRFALRQVGDVLVFSAWSPSATTDVPAAAAAFEAIRTFGQPIGTAS